MEGGECNRYEVAFVATVDPAMEEWATPSDVEFTQYVAPSLGLLISLIRRRIF
jgi:hypothetical protein